MVLAPLGRVTLLHIQEPLSMIFSPGRASLFGYGSCDQANNDEKCNNFAHRHPKNVCDPGNELQGLEKALDMVPGPRNAKKI